MITSQQRLDRMVTSILDAIEAGDDPDPLVERLGRAQPYLIAQMGLEATEEAIQRTKEADDRLFTTGAAG